jgi:hypothetical protein
MPPTVVTDLTSFLYLLHSINVLNGDLGRETLILMEYCYSVVQNDEGGSEIFGFGLEN